MDLQALYKQYIQTSGEDVAPSDVAGLLSTIKASAEQKLTDDEALGLALLFGFADDFMDGLDDDHWVLSMRPMAAMELAIIRSFIVHHIDQSQPLQMSREKVARDLGAFLTLSCLHTFGGTIHVVHNPTPQDANPSRIIGATLLPFLTLPQIGNIDCFTWASSVANGIVYDAQKQTVAVDFAPVADIISEMEAGKRPEVAMDSTPMDDAAFGTFLKEACGLLRSDAFFDLTRRNGVYMRFSQQQALQLQMRYRALLAREQINRIFRVKLSLTAASIEALDTVLQRIHEAVFQKKGGKDERRFIDVYAQAAKESGAQYMERLSIYVGACYGEMLRDAFDEMRWTMGEGTPALQGNTPEMSPRPITKVYKHIVNGQEDQILALYRYMQSNQNNGQEGRH